MTREEAIEHGKSQLEVFGGEHREFIKLAIKALEQEPKPMVEIGLYSVIKQKYIEREVLDKIRAEIIKHEADCRLSVDEHPSCKPCTDYIFETIYEILDKYNAEQEET